MYYNFINTANVSLGTKHESTVSQSREQWNFMNDRLNTLKINKRKIIKSTWLSTFGDYEYFFGFIILFYFWLFYILFKYNLAQRGTFTLKFLKLS